MEVSNNKLNVILSIQYISVKQFVSFNLQFLVITLFLLFNHTFAMFP